MTDHKRPPAGDLDRRITIEQATQSFDNAGDTISEWAPAFKLWAKRTVSTGAAGAGVEVEAAMGTIRQAEVRFEVRYGGKALSIAPETYRVRYKGRIHEIIGILEGKGRQDRIIIRTSVRPDDRGARAPETESGGS